MVVACALVAALGVEFGLTRAASRVPAASPAVAQAVEVGADPAPNGSYRVQLQSGGTWKTVGAPEFGITYTAQGVLLGKAVTRVRLVENGGTAAQLDSVLLDGKPPIAVSGSSDDLVLKKLAATDNDVTNTLGRTLVLTFATAGTRLEVCGRIQGEISKLPFEYPTSNSGTPVTGSSAFYSYKLSAGPTTIDTAAEPFMCEQVKPATGHPVGYTYAWVADDAQNLLVTIDFTSDNTLDDAEDYAMVHVKTADGVKDFKLSTAEKRWGSVAYTYTDKVAYQHKLYSFKIPLSEIGAVEGTVQLGFATYGTAAYPAGRRSPSMACDPWSNTYMMVYEKQVSATQSVVCGDILKESGYPKGSEFVISAPAGFADSNIDIAYDSVNHRYLVVWAAYPNSIYDVLYGRLVNPNGTFAGPVFEISTRTLTKHQVRTAFDSYNKRFLVVWGDDYVDVYGQLVNHNGTLYGTPKDANFPISIATGVQYQPAVAYDSAKRRFLVVWTDDRTSPTGIWGRLVAPTGTLLLGDLDISSVASQQERPSVAYDAITQHYVVACVRQDSNLDIAAQSLDASGTKDGVDHLITSAIGAEDYPSIASGGGMLYAAWTAQTTVSQVNYGLVNAAGEPGAQWNWLTSLNIPGFGRPVVVYNPRGVFKWCVQVNGPPIGTVVAAVDKSMGPDTFAPITTLHTAKLPNSRGWYKSTGAIWFTVDEENSPVTRYSWISASGPWVVGTSIAGGAAQGTRTLRYFSADSYANTETVKSRTFKVDWTRPSTAAPKKTTVARYRTAKLYYKVADAYTANKAFVKIVIKKSGVTKKTIDLGLATVNVSTYRSYKASLKKGTYRFYIYATDQAGNVQSNIASNVLVIN